MRRSAVRILTELRSQGEMTLEDISKLLSRDFKDHRDFYPLASLVSQGYIEDEYGPWGNEETNKLASKIQLIAWRLYAMSDADLCATYKEQTWQSSSRPFKAQVLALTGAGHIRLDEYETRLREMRFAVLLAIFSAVLTAAFTHLVGCC